MIGIYTIKNIINNKIYVGSSVNIKSRIYKHQYLLRKNIHTNQALQALCNKYGINNFEFEVLEECDEEFILSQENYWCNMLSSYNNKYGYNILLINTFTNTLRHSDSTKLLMSHIKKNDINNKERMKYALSCKKKPISIKEFDFNLNKVTFWNKISDAAKFYNINSSGIRMCCKGIILSYKDKYWKFSCDDEKFIKKSETKIIRIEDGKLYNTILEASLDLKIDSSNISHHLAGKIKKCKGYTFKKIKS